MRSKTTIVSCTLNPMTVSKAVMNKRVDLDVEEQTEDRKNSKHDEHVVQHRDECRAAIEKGFCVLRKA